MAEKVVLRGSSLLTKEKTRQSVMDGSDCAYDYTCATCEEDGENTEANHYCSNCGKQFCDTHLKMHNVLFKKHTVQGREKVSMWLSTSINSSTGENISVSNMSICSREEELKQMCSLHAVEIQTYCRDHDVVCCTVCVATKHRFCKEVDHIPDVAKGFTKDKSYQAMLAKMEKLKKQLKELITNRKQNREAIMESCSEVIGSIRQLRQELNHTLDELEMKTIEEIDRIMMELNETLQNHIDTSSSLHDEMASILENMEEKSKESDTYAFISQKRCKEKIREAESILNSLITQDYEVKFEPNEELTKTISDLQVLGGLKITPDLNARPIITVSSGDPFRLEKVSKHRVLTNMENLGEVSINSIAMLGNGKIAIIDNGNNTLKLLNENRVVCAQHRLLNSPHDMCALSDTRLALTFSDWTKKEIQFVDTSTGKIELQEKVKVKHSCYGIVCHDSKLYISSHTAIYVHDLNGAQEKVLYENKANRYAIFRFTVSDDGKRFYITNKSSNWLIILDDQGNRLSTFSDPELKFPSGVCTVGDGTVFVCGWESQTILHVDYEGKKRIELLARQGEGVYKPWCLLFDKAKSELMVGGYDDNLTVFTLQ